MAVSVLDIQVNSQGAVRNLNQVGAASKATEGAVNGVKNAVTGLVGAFTAVQAIKFVFAKTSELETQTKSLEVLTGSVEKAKQIIAELTQLGAVTPFTSSELIDAAKRLQAFGVEGEKVVETTRRLADVSGATGAELQGLVTAYGQVQAKGRLQGEELLQFQERGIALQDELRKMYGMTGEEFQKALSKGRISAEAVEVAIIRLTDKGGKYANGAIAQSKTLAGKFSTLMDGIESVAKKIGEVLKPALQGVLDLAILGVDAINKALAGPDYKKANDQLFNTKARITELKDAIKEAEKAGIGMAQSMVVLGTDGQVLGGGVPVLPGMKFELTQLEKQSLQLQNRLKELRAAVKPPKPTKTPKTPALLTEVAKPEKDTAADNAAKAAADEAARLKSALGSLGIEYSLKKQIYGIDNKIFEANLKNDKSTAIRLEGEKKLAEINASIAKLEFDKLTPLEKQGKIASLLVDKTIAQRDTQQQLITNQVQVAQQAEAAIRPLIEEGELLKAKLGGTEQQYQKELLIRQILKDNPTLRREEVTAIVEKNQALQQQLTQAEQLKAVYSDIGMTIKSGVVDAIQGAIDGTKSLGEVAASVLTNIANKLLDIAVNMSLFGAMSGTGTGGGLLGGLFGGGGGGGLGSVASNMAQYAPLTGFAAGGTPPVGRPSLVGERGPELFMPGVRGSIIPNNALGGGSTSVVVNVDASGSNVQGDQAQGKQLGVAISAAVQAELVKQKRPGGLLA